MPLQYPILGDRYWSANGMAVQAVAVAGEDNDWAAYIAGVPFDHSVEDTAEWCRRFGCKLEEAEAITLFRHSGRIREMVEAGMVYRR